MCIQHPKHKIKELEKSKKSNPFYLDHWEWAPWQEDSDLVAKIEDNECIGILKTTNLFWIISNNLERIDLSKTGVNDIFKIVHQW